MAVKAANSKPLFGNKRSHSCRATRHAQKCNLQLVTLSDGTKARMRARDIRTLNKAA